jgi:hypothetical protein
MGCANIYLHYALYLWATRWRQHVATDDMIIVRYADYSSASSTIGQRPRAAQYPFGQTQLP